MSLVVRGAGLKTIYAVPSATSLSIVEEIPFNEWNELLQTVATMGERVAWWIGDALAFGDAHFRSEYREAIEQLDRKWGAYRNYAWVAARIPPSYRVAGLSWSHHRAVAALDGAEQRRWLDSAERLGWTKAELEEEIRHFYGADRASAPSAPALTVRATGELYDQCTAEALRVDRDPAEWAARGLAWLVEQGSPHLAALEAA